MSATTTTTAKAATAVTFKKLPGVVAITRGIVIGDATMFSELDDGSLKPLPVIRHGIRGTQNVDMDGKDSTAGTTKRREVSNIQVTDSAKADPAAVALIVRFGIRFAPLGDMPLFVATGEKDSKEDADALRDSLVNFMARAREGDAAGLHEVARRYARNLANGRWLWRNRMVASRVTVTATEGEAEPLRFDALGIPLNQFDRYSAEEEQLALVLLAGLQGSSHSGIEVEARVEMGFKGSFEVYPSQNYLEEKAKGFARSLYCLGVPQPKGDSGVRQMGQAALRDQKVANALRTFDTWYPSFDEVRRPIAIEPNGASLEAQSFYRPVNSASSAFRLMGRLNEVDPASPDGMFMLACLIRGGVYSGGQEQMNPRVYVDLRILPSGGDARAPGVDPRATGLVFGIVHRHLRAHPGRFALALPEGRGFMAVLRVFAETREELDALAEALQDSPLVRDYAVVGYPKRVPEDFDGPWLQYRRYRIPTRRADRKEGAPCRQRRIEFAEAQGLPYLLVHSASTEQSFGLRVCVLDGTPNALPCEPDGYGLARSSAPFSLPALPA